MNTQKKKKKAQNKQRLKQLKGTMGSLITIGNVNTAMAYPAKSKAVPPVLTNRKASTRYICSTLTDEDFPFLL